MAGKVVSEALEVETVRGAAAAAMAAANAGEEVESVQVQVGEAMVGWEGMSVGGLEVKRRIARPTAEMAQQRS